MPCFTKFSLAFVFVIHYSENLVHDHRHRLQLGDGMDDIITYDAFDDGVGVLVVGAVLFDDLG